MISVLIPTYNYSAYLGRALDSVLDQGVDDVEIIVSDDASTDGTSSVMMKYVKNLNIRYHVNPENIGAVRNVNQLVSMATRDYILVLGADDYLEPGGIKNCFPRFSKIQSVAMFMGNMKY